MYHGILAIAGANGMSLEVQASGHEKALRNFHCLICSHVLQDPVSTPCGHPFLQGLPGQEVCGEGLSCEGWVEKTVHFRIHEWHVAAYRAWYMQLVT